MMSIGFILNLENRPFYEKSGKTWDSLGIFYDFDSNQEKVKENRLFHLNIIFHYLFA